MCSEKKGYLTSSDNSEVPDLPVHLCILIWAFSVSQLKYEPAHDKTANSDQPAHPPSMARVLVYLFLDILDAAEGTCDQQRLRSACISIQ